MPDSTFAFQEALQHAQEPTRHRWSHAAVKAAGAAAGWFDMAAATTDREINIVRSRFIKQYQALVNRVMSGGDVEPQNLIESDGRLNAAQVAERAGLEKASADAERYGRKMTGEQGIAAMRKALKGGAA